MFKNMALTLSILLLVTILFIGCGGNQTDYNKSAEKSNTADLIKQAEK